MISPKFMICTAASVAATVMLIRSVRADLVPQLQRFITSKFHTLIYDFSSSIIIEQGPKGNHLFSAIEIYLKTKIPKGAKKNDDIFDSFHGITCKWRFLSKSIADVPTDQNNLFELSFNKKYQSAIMDWYIPHILKVSQQLKEETKILKIFTLNNNKTPGGPCEWQCVNVDHPQRFDTLAMDTHEKAKFISHLDLLVRAKEEHFFSLSFGYLLYGPPGRGKSRLIAAMANYLNFDIYDIKLTRLSSLSQLRNLVISTPKNSILVLKDFYFSTELHSKGEDPRCTTDPGYDPNQVTLTGLIDFLRGIEVTYFKEKRLVFVTDHMVEIHPDFFRRFGLLDMHIYMPYSSMSISKTLTSEPQSKLKRMEDVIKTIKLTLTETCGDPILENKMIDSALQGLIELLEKNKAEESERMAIVSLYGLQ